MQIVKSNFCPLSSLSSLQEPGFANIFSLQTPPLCRYIINDVFLIVNPLPQRRPEQSDEKYLKLMPEMELDSLDLQGVRVENAGVDLLGEDFGMLFSLVHHTSLGFLQTCINTSTVDPKFHNKC